MQLSLIAAAAALLANVANAHQKFGQVGTDGKIFLRRKDAGMQTEFEGWYPANSMSEAWPRELEEHTEAVQATPKSIPKIIWLTQKTHNDHDALIDLLHALNPGYTIYFVNDTMQMQFIKEIYPKEYLDTYKKIHDPAHRADFWRYLVLLKYGGYYINVDNQPVMSMDAISYGYDFVSVIAATEPSGVHVHNGFIASVPGNFALQYLADMFFLHPNPPKNYRLYKHHFYVRHFYVWLNNYLQGLAPLKSYSVQGLRTFFLYHEHPQHYAINGDAAVALMVGTLKDNPLPVRKVPTPPNGFPFLMDLKTKAWHPVKPPDVKRSDYI